MELQKLIEEICSTKRSMNLYFTELRVKASSLSQMEKDALVRVIKQRVYELDGVQA